MVEFLKHHPAALIVRAAALACWLAFFSKANGTPEKQEFAALIKILYKTKPPTLLELAVLNMY